MIVQKTAMRNRGIFAAYERGESAGDLANRYELFNITVDQIIRCKRHKIAVSGEAFYKEIRSQKLSVQPQIKLLRRSTVGPEAA
jgi:hypothetical protein